MRRQSLLVAATLFAASPALAYRPFIGTDASVADLNVLELEFGYFGLARTEGQNTYSGPQAVLNYGVLRRMEAVAEFVNLHPQGGRSQIVDASLNLKAVVREGVLQDKSGPSLAEESTLLLPSRASDEKHAGFQQAFILSQRLDRVSLHWEAGGGFEREASLPFAIWGLIAELPVARGVRAVGELNGSETRSSTPDNSGLVGAIWQTPWHELALDAGYRRGISAAAADWSVTAGFTVPFSLFGKS